MRLDVEARQLGVVDTTALRAFLEAQPQDVWHFSCDMIPTLDACDRIILRHSRDYNFDLHDIVDWPMMERFRPHVAPLVDFACTCLGKARVAALFIANLPKGACIYPHIDQGEFLEVPARVHIPIKTNPDVFYFIGGCYVDNPMVDVMERQILSRKFHMREGEVWEIDNLSYHSVRNGGDCDRWHLIMNLW